MTIAVFEDQCWQNFDPLSLTRPAFDIKVGARSFLEEFSHVHGQKPDVLLARQYLTQVAQEEHPDIPVNPDSLDGDTLFVNGLVHPAVIDIARFLKVGHSFAVTSQGRLLVGRLPAKSAQYLARQVLQGKPINLKKLEVSKSTDLGPSPDGILTNIWDIIRVLESSLTIQTSFPESTADLEGIHVLGQHPVVIDGAEVEDGTVIDNRKAGVYIGQDAHVQACRITGPAYIEGKTHVKQFSLIESSYIGYNCRVAGEIEHSIIMDHSNKAHDGFLGHSYVGQWVNIGAMTTTSDLKMTYGKIKMAGQDTAQNKVGSFFADMVKTSIGTLIYSGLRIGVSSHLHGLVSGDVPAFTMYGKGLGSKNVELELASAMETQRRMMSRRDREMSKAYQQMMEHIFEMTALARKKDGVRKGRFSV